MAMPVALIWELIALDKGASATFNRVGTAASLNAKRINEAGVAATRTGAAMGRASRGFSTLTGVSAKLGVTIGVAAAAIAAFSEGQQFQKQMLQIQTLTGGTADEVARMSDELLNLAPAVAAGPNDLAVSLYHVESVGLRGAKALGVVTIAAQGAKVGMADLEETTNALTSTVASGIPGVHNMSQAMGALLSIVGAGDMKMSDLNQALGGGILSVVKGYGLSLTDVGAALATFGDNNIRGADAATALRMAVQSLAVPAARGKDAIESIDLSMTTLQKDMQTGGLNKALLDLNEHMRTAGITSIQTGAYLTEAFGKRAGIGLSVLMNQIDRFEQKTRAVQEGAGSFADKWTETTHTVGFAFDRIGAQLQALGVRAFEAAGPSLTSFANFLGVTIPHAISQTVDVLRPLISTVQGVFVTAWHAATAVLGAVGSALGTVGGFLKEHKTLVTSVATAVLAMWAAFKAYTIAKLAIGVVIGLAAKLSIAVRTAALNVRSFGSTLSNMSAGTAAASAGMAGLGIIVAGLAYNYSQSAQYAAEAAARTDAYTQAIKDDSDTLGANTRAQVENNLAKAGAYDEALKVGISEKTLTDAAMGNAAAQKALRAALDGTSTSAHLNGFEQLKLGGTLSSTRSELLAAIATRKHLAAADGEAGAAANSLALGTQGLTQFQKDLTNAQKETQIAIDGTTYAMRGQASAADILTAALARLSGDRNAVALAQLALQDALAGVRAQVKQNGTALDENTKKGRSNLEWLHQQINTINNVADAQIKNNAGAKLVTRTLRENEAALRKVAISAGFSAKQVDHLIKRYAATPKKVDTYIKAHTDQASTAALALNKRLEQLTKQRVAIIKAGADPLSLLHVQDQMDALLKPRTLPVTPVLTTNVLASPRFLAANDIPKHAAGGMTTGRHLAVVGDNRSGRELILPTDSPRTISALSSALAQAGAAGGAPAIHLRVFIGDRELRDIVRVEVDDHADHHATIGRMHQ